MLLKGVHLFELQKSFQAGFHHQDREGTGGNEQLKKLTDVRKISPVNVIKR